MCDIEKILKAFEDNLNSKPQKAKVVCLRDFGFQVRERKEKNKECSTKAIKCREA